MSDIDQYLTDEVAETALAAGNTASECYYGCPSDMTTTEMHAALSAVLPDIIRQVKAEALREAARAYQWGGWARNPQARGDMRAKSSQAEHAVKWLRDQADEIAGDDS